MRVSKNRLNSNLRREILNSFIQALDDLKGLQEKEIFLNDFFNLLELDTYIKRLAIAYWLKKGRSYENIKNNLKVSSATIAVVEKQMDTPGFKLALKKMTAEEWATVWSEKIKKFTS